MTPDDLALLSHAIPDHLRAASHDDLAEAVGRIAEWIRIVKGHVRWVDIAGEDIKCGDLLSRGPDELLYRTRSPIEYIRVLGASRYNAPKGYRVEIVENSYGEAVLVDERPLVSSGAPTP